MPDQPLENGDRALSLVETLPSREAAESEQAADGSTDEAPQADVAGPEYDEADSAAEVTALEKREMPPVVEEETTTATVERADEEAPPAPSELVKEAVTPGENGPEIPSTDTQIAKLREASPDAAAVEPAPEQKRAKVEKRERPSEPEPGVESPTFDVVRVTPEGEAVIAGRAEPGAEVTVREGARDIATTRADDRGQWVVVPEEPLESGDRALSLIETLRTGEVVDSEQVVVVSIPEVTTRLDEEPAGEAPAPKATPAEEQRVPLAVLTERDGDEPSRVLQKPRETAEPDVQVSLESVDYDDAGEMTVVGRVEPGASVNVYVDEEYVGKAEAGEEGVWQLRPGEKLEPGTHRVRVDKVDRKGVVLARIETPLVRAARQKIQWGDALVVVQPGNSLWRIARRAYGGGVQYTVIYEANRDQIRDPNFIYPGQIFSVP